MVSSVAFFLLVALVALERLAEVSWSRRNERRLLARGGREHAPEQMKWMKLLHTAWLAAMLIEVVWLDRVSSSVVSGVALLVFAVGQGLRYAAMWSLGDRWTVRILTVPGEPVRTRGIYRWLRHPNYFGVCLEIAALPLVHGAWLTASIATVLNLALLAFRIPAEERALAGDEDYERAFPSRSWSGASSSNPDGSGRCAHGSDDGRR